MTPDEIRAAQPSRELDLEFARAVGLPIAHQGDARRYRPGVVSGIHGPQIRYVVFADPEWHPSTDIGQALEWAGKYATINNVGWKLSFEPLDNAVPYFFAVDNSYAFADSAALAVVRCVLLAQLGLTPPPK